jgi:hypothetical protein
VRLLLLVIALASSVQAQSSNVLWSQVETYVGLTPNTDLMFMAAGTPGAGDTQPRLVLGPNFDLQLLPFLSRIKSINPERRNHLSFRAGYRYVQNLYGHDYVQNNGVLELTPRYPLPLKLQVADRNRIDLRGLHTGFAWRYRNRLTVARTFDIRRFNITPYGEAEIYYDCTTGQWSQYSYTFGAFSKVTPRIQVESWYKRQTTITEPVTTTNVVEVKLSLFFRSVTN